MILATQGASFACFFLDCVHAAGLSGLQQSNAGTPSLLQAGPFVRRITVCAGPFTTRRIQKGSLSPVQSCNVIASKFSTGRFQTLITTRFVFPGLCGSTLRPGSRNSPSLRPRNSRLWHSTTNQSACWRASTVGTTSPELLRSRSSLKERSGKACACMPCTFRSSRSGRRRS